MAPNPNTAAPREAARLYREALAESRTPWEPGNPSFAGRWVPDPQVAPEQLAAALAEAESSPSAAVIKNTPRIRVARAALFGRDVLVKRYDLVGPGDRIRYLFRPSRARRAWAAARAFRRLGIPTPEPLGFLEIRSGLLVHRSYVLTEFLADAMPAHKWILPHFAKQPPEAREGLRRQLVDAFLGLHRKGVYHGDTKAHNLLVRHPDDPARRTFHWIDLECVRFGVRPTRRQVVRNLVQLNGSLRSKVDLDDRMAFLRDLAGAYPWVESPVVVRHIRRWTERRLRKERVERCGS